MVLVYEQPWETGSRDHMYVYFDIKDISFHSLLFAFGTNSALLSKHLMSYRKLIELCGKAISQTSSKGEQSLSLLLFTYID